MEVLFALLVLVMPVVFGKGRKRDESQDWKADRPAGPGAESMAVPEAGEIGPAAEPPPPRDRRPDRE